MPFDYHRVAPKAKVQSKNFLFRRAQSNGGIARRPEKGGSNSATTWKKIADLHSPPLSVISKMIAFASGEQLGFDELCSAPAKYRSS
jgi:hypothetical protein